MLKGRAVDEAILALLAKPPSDAVQAELLLAVADRRIFAAKAAVAAALTAESPKVRLQALQDAARHRHAVGRPGVLDLLLKSDDDAGTGRGGDDRRPRWRRRSARPTGARAPSGCGCSARRIRRFACGCIGLLPRIGDNSMLPLLRTSLDDADPEVFDAAVRALAAWPTAAARDDVFRLARDSRGETHRLLAIRGLVRIIELERYRDPEAAVADLRQAAGFSWRPEEQLLVLAALAQFPCKAALELAQGFLREPTVAGGGAGRNPDNNHTNDQARARCADARGGLQWSVVDRARDNG